MEYFSVISGVGTHRKPLPAAQGTYSLQAKQIIRKRLEIFQIGGLVNLAKCK